MKIAYLTHQFYPRHVGGVEVYTLGLARRAQAHGHEVLVITYSESPSRHFEDFGRAATEVDGVPVTEIHYNLSRAPVVAEAEYDNAFTATHVRDELLRFQPDVVHIMHAMKLSGSAVEVCYALGIPVIVALCDYWFLCPRHSLLKWDGSECGGPQHELYCTKCLIHTHGVLPSQLMKVPEPLLWALLSMGLRLNRDNPALFWQNVRAITRRKEHLRGLLARANRVYALSRFQKSVFTQHGYADDAIELIAHGLETGGLESDHGARPAVPTLVFIGSLVQHKGLDVVLNALAACPELELELRVYSGKTETPYAKQMMAMMERDPRVQFRGTFPISEQGRILREASALVMPALWHENNPLVVQAALYMGLPVLASDIGSLSEMVSSDDAGWLIPAGDVGAWAAALRRFVTHTWAASTPANHGVKSMDAHAEELFAIYATLIREKHELTSD